MSSIVGADRSQEFASGELERRGDAAGEAQLFEFRSDFPGSPSRSDSRIDESGPESLVRLEGSRRSLRVGPPFEMDRQ